MIYIKSFEEIFSTEKAKDKDNNLKRKGENISNNRNSTIGIFFWKFEKSILDYLGQWNLLLKLYYFQNYFFTSMKK